MSDGPYQRANCEECPESWEGPTALMNGKRHHNQTGHRVFWLQETSGYWWGDDDE